jgi:hypothetical protein
MKSGKLALFLTVWFLAALPVSAGTLSPCTSVTGNLIANCGFETGSFAGWTQGGNTSETFVGSGMSSGYSGPNSGSEYALLGPNGYGNLTQVLPTAAGQIYILSFYFASLGDKNSNFLVSWNGDNLMSLTQPETGAAFSQFSYQVSGTGSDTLEFLFRDNRGSLALDDVSVSPAEIQPPVPNPPAGETPEPGTIGMLLVGAGAVLAVRRRLA